MVERLKAQTSMDIDQPGVKRLQDVVNFNQTCQEFTLSQQVSFSLKWHHPRLPDTPLTDCKVVVREGAHLWLYLTSATHATSGGKRNEERDTGRVLIDEVTIEVAGQPNEVRKMLVNFRDGSKTKVMPPVPNQQPTSFHVPRLH